MWKVKRNFSFVWNKLLKARGIKQIKIVLTFQSITFPYLSQSLFVSRAAKNISLVIIKLLANMKNLCTFPVFLSYLLKANASRLHLKQIHKTNS